MRTRNLTRSRLAIVVAIGVLSVFAALPAIVGAQDSTNDPSSAQYDPPIPDADTGSAGASSASGSSGSGGGSGLDSNIGSLPFTGMDLLIVAGVALVLTGTGFALRRLSTPRGPAS